MAETDYEKLQRSVGQGVIQASIPALASFASGFGYLFDQNNQLKTNLLNYDCSKISNEFNDIINGYHQLNHYKNLVIGELRGMIEELGYGITSNSSQNEIFHALQFNKNMRDLKYDFHFFANPHEYFKNLEESLTGNPLEHSEWKDNLIRNCEIPLAENIEIPTTDKILLGVAAITGIAAVGLFIHGFMKEWKKEQPQTSLAANDAREAQGKLQQMQLLHNLA